MAQRVLNISWIIYQALKKILIRYYSGVQPQQEQSLTPKNSRLFIRDIEKNYVRFI